jgi:hypothetical protein
LRGRAYILVRCITAVLFLAMATVRSGVCHVHTHDDEDAHEVQGAGDGHGGSCDHHSEWSVPGNPAGMPGSSPESGTCCSSSPSSFAVRQSGDVHSGKGATAQTLHVALCQAAWRGPIAAVRARSADPPGRTPPLMVSSRLRI